MARKGFGKLAHTPSPASIAAIQSAPTSDEQPEQPFLPVALPKQQRNRIGRKLVAGHFPKEVSDSLRILAVEESTTVEKLLGEAINDLLRKHGKHPLA